MQANAIIYTGQIVSTLIGNDLLTKAISDTAGTIYNLLYGLVELQDPILERAIDELDVKAQIKCVESIIGNLDKGNITKSLNISLEQLHDIICRIREDLKQINSNFTLHQQKYFYYYRKIDNSIEILNLRRHKKILDQRLDMFMKIFTIDNINQNYGSGHNHDNGYNNDHKSGQLKKYPSKYVKPINDIKTKSVHNPNVLSYSFKNKHD